MKDIIEKRLVGLFVLILAVMCYMAWTSIKHVGRAMDASAWVNHTHDVILQTGDIMASLHSGDASLRDYLMTGDRRDQAAYRSAYSEMKQHLDEAKALTRQGETDLNAQFLEAEKIIGTRIDFTRSVVQAREKGFEAARDALAANPNLDAMDKLNFLMQAIVQKENSRLVERDRQAHTEALATQWVLNLGVAIDFILLVFVSWLIRDDLKARRSAARALEEHNAQLEIKVRERTSQLVESNTSLTRENLERKWSNQALDHQLRYSQLIINSIDDPVFAISKAVNITRINAAVIRVAGWEPTEIIARPLDRILQLPAAAGKTAAAAMSQAMRDGREIQDRPAQFLFKDGRSIPVHFSLVPLHDQDKIVGGVVTVRVSRVVPST